MTTETPETRTPTAWERFLPWLVGLAGTASFLRPLVADPSNTVLDRVFWYDAQYSIDAITAIHRALATGPNGRDLLDWLYDDLFFFPQPRVLAISELVPWVALATYPLKGAPVLAYNVALAVACVLNVVAGTSFARALGARAVASLLGGLTLAFGAYANFESGRLQLLLLFPLAWGLAAALRFARDRKARDAVLVGVNLFVAGGTCLYYLMFLALLVPPAVLFARLSERRPGVWRDLRPLVLSMLAALLPLGLLLLPYRDLGAHLAVQHTVNDVRAQAGDPLYLFWADHLTPAGWLLNDVYRWDTAYWPGLVAMVGSVAMLLGWARRAPWLATRVVGPVLVGLLLSLVLTVNALFVGFAIALYFLVFRRLDDRPNRPSAALVFVVAVAVVGWFVWDGPAPSLFGRPTGQSPYWWLVEYAPFFGGLRMVRRMGVVFTLLASGVAAVWLSRWEGRRGVVLAVGVLAFTFVESMPLRLPTRRIPTTCEDAPLRALRDAGVKAVAEVPTRPLKDHEKTIARHRASTCGVATTLGPAVFRLFLTRAVDERLAALPDPFALASLRALGIGHVVYRDQPSATRQRSLTEGLAVVSTNATTFDDDVLVELANAVEPMLPGGATGRPHPVASVSCVPKRECERLIDGDDDERWTNGGRPKPTDAVVVTFARTRVTGLRWHHEGFPLDLPLGLRIDARDANGDWVPWLQGAVDVRGLGREAKRPVLDVALPAREVDALRLSPLGTGGTTWWSGTELEILRDE